MQLTQITPEVPLYSISDVFPASIRNQLNTINWKLLPGVNVNEGNRVNLTLPIELDREINHYVHDTLLTSIENEIKIKFIDVPLCGICWYNTPGYQSMIHTDGCVSATMQIYWEPLDNTEHGTCFYNSCNTDDILHYFPSIQNTGYLALYTTSTRPLWHGTTCPLPSNILRVSFMFQPGRYIIL